MRTTDATTKATRLTCIKCRITAAVPMVQQYGKSARESKCTNEGACKKRVRVAAKQKKAPDAAAGASAGGES